MVRYHIVVSGLVQEVGFRFFVYHSAVNLKLTGWVRNCYDGTVEIEAQGGEESLDRFTQTLITGNGFSKVEYFSSKATDVKIGEKVFRITY